MKVVIVEDHPVFRDGLAALLSGRQSLHVVAAVGSCAEGLALEQQRPDVVVVDLRLPDGSGADLVRQVREQLPETRVLLLTSSDDHADIVTALQAGHGYLLKTAPPQEVVDAVVAVGSGSAVVADTVLKLLAERAAGVPGTRAARAFPALTDREYEVLDRMARGRGTHQVARELGLSEKTVRNHVSNVLVKLGVRDRSAAVVLAHQHGVGSITS